ncbi:MAG: serpin family protein [Rhodothermaceae bacterium]|nr:serpin family protein [Rhodothermaceae bacterium]
MKTFITYAFSALLLISLASCDLFSAKEKQDVEPVKIELTPDAVQVIAGNNDFGIDLFTRTAASEPGNLMLSPLSASAALTMLLNGADGDTRGQIRDMLGYDAGMTDDDINKAYQSLVSQLLKADKKVSLAIANAIFYRQHFPFKTLFLNTMASDFDATVKGLDFDNPSSVDTINRWASDNTNKKIPKVINGISSEMVMFIMNALYFKGDWTDQFNKSDTRKMPFHLDDETTVDVDMMKGKVGVIRHYNDEYSAVEVPYGRKNFSMVIIVPRGTLQEFYQGFTAGTWSTLTASLDNGEWFRTDVNMPKFSFEYEKVLNDQLNSLGMTDAFAEALADLSGISDADLFVSFVKQNTFIEVNEEGTEAAAVTTIGIEVTSAPPSFTVDKPFIFAIRERTTNTLLFIGGVTNPAE